MINSQMVQETLYILQGQENFINRKYQEALPYFQKLACYKNSFQAIAQYKIALCNIKLNQFKCAIEDLKAYINLQGESKEVLSKLAYCYLMLGKGQKATELYLKIYNIINVKEIENDLEGVL